MKPLNFFLSVAMILTLSFQAHADNSAVINPSAVSDEALTLQTYYKPLIPEKIHGPTSINIYKSLKRNHFNSLKLDDAFSSNLLDKYLEDLDGSRVYFLASDIKEFEVYRRQFDNAIKKGDLKPAYHIFNRYQKRLIERLIYMVKNLRCCYDRIDFEKDESYDTDREKKPWPQNMVLLDKLWHKRLKNEIIAQKLSDKEPDGIKELLEKRYLNQLNRSRQIKSEDAFRIYMNSFTRMYDPHTQYFSPRASEDFNIRMSLSLEGIGALLQTENEFTKVLRLVPAGPADKSKLLKAGDRIIGVGQGAEGEVIDVIGWRLDDVVQLIRGPKDTVVQLKIIPSTAPDDHQTKTIKITRNTVKLEEQAAQKEIIKLDNSGKSYKLGVITIPTFYIDFNAYQAGAPDYKSTTRDVKKLLNELKQENVDGIIIDLRENGGGALHEATSLTGLFIKTGPIVIVRQANNSYSVHPDENPEIVYDGPLAVLVNRMSASASEIFAGAIKDHKRGIILGTQTFGKGTVQSLVPLNQGQLKLTMAKFYRILGESTQHKGIIPDISFPSLYNFDEIGESALDEALPWDKTQPRRFTPFTTINMEPVINSLKELHEKRITDSADFKYLTEYNTYYKNLQKKTLVSLNFQKRKKEKVKTQNWLLNLENTLKKAKGEQPYASYEAFEKEQDKKEEADPDGDENSRDSENDILLSESQQIMIDYINLLNK